MPDPFLVCFVLEAFLFKSQKSDDQESADTDKYAIYKVQV